MEDQPTALQHKNDMYICFFSCRSLMDLPGLVGSLPSELGKLKRLLGLTILNTTVTGSGLN